MKRGFKRKAPIPKGPFSGPRKPWRRVIALFFAYLDRIIDKTFIGRFLQRYNLKNLEIKNIKIPIKRGNNGIHGLKICFLTDIHAGCSFSEKELFYVFNLVKDRDPDIILFGGDLINTKEKEIYLYEKPLKLLNPRYGIYAVPGNHDYFYGKELKIWTNFLKKAGVHILINQAHNLKIKDSNLWIAGVDDLTEGNPDLSKTLRDVPLEDPVILISHHPDFFFEAAAAYVDLTLSGHTHGGQIFFCKKILGHSKFGYWEGLFKEEESYLYVSRGIGTTLLPFRIKVKPELTIITLEKPI